VSADELLRRVQPVALAALGLAFGIPVAVAAGAAAATGVAAPIGGVLVLVLLLLLAAVLLVPELQLGHLGRRLAAARRPAAVGWLIRHCGGRRRL